MRFKPGRKLKIAFTLALLGAQLYARAENVAAKKEKSNKWQASIPAVAENNEDWQKLVPALLENKMSYGALAAARNMLNFFADLGTKEMAYTTIIRLIDLGYPFTTRPFFIPGDIEPNSGTEFGKNYFFYKALAEVDKKMNRWATSQFEKIDKDNFPKYIFYQAMQSYGAGQTNDAIVLLKKSLGLVNGKESLNLAKKEARTLARIYYEREEFDKSLDIYQTFLLKVNPITPGDWVEAAWNLYRLKHYPEALGYVYNLDSREAGPTFILEQYILRALIYREYCSVKSVDQLSKNFDKQFGNMLNGIKLGEPLTANPEIVKIEHPDTVEYRQAVQSIDEMNSERKRIKSLPKKLRPLAEYLYSTELSVLARRKGMLENDALQVLAKHLVILGESMRYLKFDVMREKFNPDVVFSEEKPAETLLVDDTDEANFRLHWRQWGDFWNDERMLYRGDLKNRCEN